MQKKYERLVELFVKPDLRDEIKSLKREQTYDEFLRLLIKKNIHDVGKHRLTTPKSHKSGGHIV